ncbi:unnamed protein product, partial [Mesorhabditis belari]|uniref:Uncharacterized protein n=1 Tax=Mesorhabditis belari TaxID=2138241 RepID=A0AAF3EF65_9BILA
MAIRDHFDAFTDQNFIVDRNRYKCCCGLLSVKVAGLLFFIVELFALGGALSNAILLEQPASWAYFTATMVLVGCMLATLLGNRKTGKIVLYLLPILDVLAIGFCLAGILFFKGWIKSCPYVGAAFAFLGTNFSNDAKVLIGALIISVPLYIWEYLVYCLLYVYYKEKASCVNVERSKVKVTMAQQNSVAMSTPLIAPQAKHVGGQRASGDRCVEAGPSHK